ncbi:MAG: hypothetical protein AB9882_15345 [Ignavibacteriaceae bacterium]
MLRICLLFIIVMLFASCKDSGTGGNPFPDKRYKIDTGSQWVYRTQITNQHYDTLWVYQSRDSIVQNSIVTCLSENDSVLSTGPLTKLRSETTEGQNTYAQLHWYIHNPGNLIRFAYSNAGASAYVFPKSKNSKYLTVDEYRKIREYLNYDISPSKALNDTIMKYESQQILLRYPLKVGDSWQMSTAPFMVARKILGIENISTALGIIETYKLESTLSSFNLTYYDYINLDYGLVRRMWRDTLVKTGEADPTHPIGYIIWNEESSLISR